MTIIRSDPDVSSSRLHAVAETFLNRPGLPFADVLGADDIERAFAEHDALFAADAIFSYAVVLWAFLGQSLRDGKGAACAAAVADITNYAQQLGLPVPSGDTGDYCRARAKLPPAVLQTLTGHVAEGLDAQAPQWWLWHGRHGKLVDGFTFTMPDTPANQQAFPQLSSQEPGVGFPIARACAVLSLATGAIHDLAMGPYQGKETGEPALLREILDSFHRGDVAVFDRCFCSYMMLALLQCRGVDVCARRHQCRQTDLRGAKCLGRGERLVTWRRPQRPEWMSEGVYAAVPETLTLREVTFDVSEPGKRTERITVVTTLTDPATYPAEDIAELYGFRWNAELDILQIKQTLHRMALPFVGRVFGLCYVLSSFLRSCSRGWVISG